MSDGMAETAVRPPDVYAVFCGGIEQATGQRLVNFLSLAASGPRRPSSIHVLFQSAGGFVGDGIFFYNLFRALPVDLVLYNGGQIASAGVTAYLGAKHRVTTANAAFMMHKTTNSPFGDSAKLQKISKNFALDDSRTEMILREHITNMPEAHWQEMQTHDLYLSGQDAAAYGIAHRIGEFAPPLGTPLFNVLA